MRQALKTLALLGAGLAAMPALAQDRSTDNAVTQAEDAFGLAVGREALGIYNGGMVRGFSPSAAGNVRIDGLYADPVFDLSGLLIDSTSIKVGLSAQGYPFAAPSGIVDNKVRRPEDKAGASLVANGDSFGTAAAELTGSLPLNGALSLGYGLNVTRTGFADGTDNFNHSQALMLRWRPAPGVEVMPFYTLFNDYNDESGPFYVPGGKYLPPQPPRHRFDGPEWADFRLVASTQGLLASYAPGKNWLVRLGAFRSVFDQKRGFTNLLLDVQPDGSAQRLLIADPRQLARSLSGELRITHSIPDGNRLHLFHLSLRERSTRREFGGSQEFDLGPTRIGEPEDALPPAVYSFDPVGNDQVRQHTLGLAYAGRWKGVGELGLGLSKADYRKITEEPGQAATTARARPWLYNASLAVFAAKSLSFYAGYARGLEGSGVAPPNASNRNAPMPAIITTQKDAGLRWAITDRFKLISGVFELTRPYFGFDAARRFGQVGTTRNRGIEFSLSGPLTKRLDLVAGGMLLDARVERDPAAIGTIGRRPVGLPSHLFNVNLAWRTPFLKGFTLDSGLFLRGRVPSTTDNLVTIPERKIVSLGARYSFKVEDKNVTARVQVSNLFDQRAYVSAGPGVYGAAPPRYVNFFVAVDL